MEPTYSDSAAFLRDVFSTKTQSNPRYSMRAFAKLLGLSPGGLSLILTRKKRLSFERAHEIARRLDLSPQTLEQFILLIQLDGTSDPRLKSELQSKLAELQGGKAIFDLGVDQFKLIADWYGLAILILFTEVHPTPSRKNAAKYLGISLYEVDATLERLQRLELIEKAGGDFERPKFKRPIDTIVVEALKPNEAIRSYYRNLIPKCLTAIDSQTPAEKVIGSQTFAFDPEQLDEVRTLTDRYLDSLNALSAKGKKRTQLYQAFCNVFRLTQTPIKSEKEKK